MISSRIIWVATVLVCGVVNAQTPPVITTGPNGATSAAFWYLGGVTPNCCGSLTDKYWTIWDVDLTTNSPNPTPFIQWFTDSPTKIQITPNGITGARLTALGHSAPGTTFDIHVWVQVDAVSSAQFPVFINTPWIHNQTVPAATTCTSLFGAGWNGWAGRVSNFLEDLTTATITPIDSRETFENDQKKFPNTTWGPPSETTWSSIVWQGNTFSDAYAMCWQGTPAPTPPTVSWNGNGVTAISTDTQKYWIGSFNRFKGKCTERKVVTFYTDHVFQDTFTTPITNDGTNGPCAQGQFANQ